MSVTPEDPGDCEPYADDDPPMELHTDVSDDFSDLLVNEGDDSTEDLDDDDA